MPRVAKREFVKVRCTAEEKAAWQAKADAQGVTVADLMRRCADLPTSGKAKARPVVRRIAEADPALIRQLAAMGNNLNQLAKAVNTHGFESHDSARLLAYLASIQATLDTLRDEAKAVASAQ